jgi:hypothetical protein
MTASLRLTVLAVALPVTLAACSSAPATDQAAPAASSAAAAAPASAPSTDPEFEAVKAATPVVACDIITLEEVSAIYPGITFTLKTKLDPRMSGYAWDSRCEYEAGVGTVEFAKNVPTHSVQVFVNTVASEAKAQSNLKSRAETAATTPNYKAQPELGPSGYTTTATGTASAFLTKGQSEIQLLVSELKSPNDEKIRKLLTLAKSL